MSVTGTKAPTVQNVLSKANLNDLADVLRKVDLGKKLATVKIVVAALAATAAVDITTAAVKAAATITGIALDTGENLPPIGVVSTLRVVASGTAGSLGPYIVSDAGATPAIPPTATAYAGAAIGVASLSNDGKTLTFPNTVTAFTLTYQPREAVVLTTGFAEEGT